MEPNLLVPPSFTDPGIIERVVAVPGKSGREAWDPASKAWVPSGAVTDSLAHARPLTPAELAAAGIPSGGHHSMKLSDIHFLPDLTPKLDERFSALLKGAVSGDVPVYFAAVPLAICVPFDLDYRPDLHPVGEQLINQMIDAWNNGQFQKLFVYQRGKWFVVSDNYIALFAALRGQPDYVPCWVLGKPDSDLARDVQGPIASEDVLKLLGI